MYQEILVYLVLVTILAFIVFHYLKRKRKKDNNYCGDCALKDMCDRHDIKDISSNNRKHHVNKDVNKYSSDKMKIKNDKSLNRKDV